MIKSDPAFSAIKIATEIVMTFKKKSREENCCERRRLRRGIKILNRYAANSLCNTFLCRL